MRLNKVIKTTAVWLLIVVLAIINGMAREDFLAPLIGMHWALPFSGISLSLMVLFTCYFTVEWMGCRTTSICWQVGIQWVMMTLAFEFLFGHYVRHKPWSEIFQVFNFIEGNLFSLVLLICLIGPRMIYQMKKTAQYE